MMLVVSLFCVVCCLLVVVCCVLVIVCGLEFRRFGVSVFRCLVFLACFSVLFLWLSRVVLVALLFSRCLVFVVCLLQLVVCRLVRVVVHV